MRASGVVAKYRWEKYCVAATHARNNTPGRPCQEPYRVSSPAAARWRSAQTTCNITENKYEKFFVLKVKTESLGKQPYT